MAIPHNTHDNTNTDTDSRAIVLIQTAPVPERQQYNQHQFHSENKNTTTEAARLVVDRWVPGGIHYDNPVSRSDGQAQAAHLHGAGKCAPRSCGKGGAEGHMFESGKR